MISLRSHIVLVAVAANGGFGVFIASIAVPLIPGVRAVVPRWMNLGYWPLIGLAGIALAGVMCWFVRARGECCAGSRLAVEPFQLLFRQRLAYLCRSCGAVHQTRVRVPDLVVEREVASRADSPKSRGKDE